MFDLEQHEETELATDNLGGGTIESAIYDATVKMAWVEKKVSGAIFVNFIFDINGREYKENFCVASGDAKGNKVYYEKNGKRFNLPGFTQVYNICAITTGKALNTLANEAEDDQIMVYDFQSAGEIEVTVPVIKELIGKSLKLGINRIKVNKRAQNADGIYVEVPESKEVNELHTSFDPKTMLTVSERQNKISEAEFYKKWATKFAGNTVNKYKQNVPPLETAQLGSDAPSPFM